MSKTNFESYPKVYLYRRIVQAKLYIDHHYAEPIDLNNISDEAFFSKFHFIRLFKKTYGKTPHQYLISVRIKKAMAILHTNPSVSEACFLVGFESISSFSGLFKRVVGLNPSAYTIQQQIIQRQMTETPLKFVPACFAHQNGWIKK